MKKKQKINFGHLIKGKYLKINDGAYVRHDAIKLVFISQTQDKWTILAEGFHKPSDETPNVYWKLGEVDTREEAIEFIEQLMNELLGYL
jgi:hypothetical protein